jgi:hypothetical protein
MQILFLIIILISFVVVIGLLLNYQYKQTNHYKNQFLDVCKFTNNKIPHNLEMINLGSNQPKFAFDYSKTEAVGMNWAVGPQSLEYDFRILKQMHNFLKANAFVVIPICPFSFFLYRFRNDSENYKYYNFLDSSMINNYSSQTKKLYIDYPLFTAKRNLIRLIKDTPVDERPNIKTNPMNEAELTKDAYKWLNGWLKQFSLTGLDNISLSKENKSNIDKNVTVLSEMIDFCLKNTYKPIIMMLPVTKALSNLFSQSFIDDFIIANINKANTKNIPVLNYLKDERFVSPELYFNSFFFNENGRKIFTKIVIEELSNL